MKKITKILLNIFYMLSIITLGTCGKKSDAPEFSSTSSEPVLIRYKWKVGQVNKTVTHVEMNMDMDVLGKKIIIPMKMKMKIDMKAGNVDGKNNANIGINIKHIKMDMAIPEAKTVHFDSDKDVNTKDPQFKPLLAMLNKTIVMNVSSTGKVLNLSVNKLLNNLNRPQNRKFKSRVKETLDQMVNSAFIPFPQNPVKTGDVYDAGKVEQKIPGAGNMFIEMKYKVLSISGDKKKILLQPIGRFTMDSSKKSMLKMKIESGDIKGWMLFDNEAGHIMKSDIKSTIAVNMIQNGKNFGLKINSRIKYSSDLK